MFWKVIVVMLLFVAIAAGVGGWTLGMVDEWEEGKVWCYIALACIIAGIILYPLANREEGLGYFGTLRKYFF